MRPTRRDHAGASQEKTETQNVVRGSIQQSYKSVQLDDVTPGDAQRGHRWRRCRRRQRVQR